MWILNNKFIGKCLILEAILQQYWSEWIKKKQKNERNNTHANCFGFGASAAVVDIL